MQVIINEETGLVMCGWFALCENEANGVVAHPILEYVPTCERCATKLDLTLIPATFDMEGCDR